MTLTMLPSFVLSRVDDSVPEAAIHAENFVVGSVVNVSFQLKMWSFHVVISKNRWNGKFELRYFAEVDYETDLVWQLQA